MHEIEVTVDGWKVFLLIEAATKMPLGVIERQRQLNLGLLVQALVGEAGTPGGAYEADVLRASLEFEVPHVARSVFYRWFDEPLERFMEACRGLWSRAAGRRAFSRALGGGTQHPTE